MGQSGIESLQYLRRSTARYAAKIDNKEEAKITHVTHAPLVGSKDTNWTHMTKSRAPKVAETVRKENIFLESGFSMKPSETRALNPMINPIMTIIGLPPAAPAIITRSAAKPRKISGRLGRS
jgi:hypothetical protein